jgi:hypothetical protein
VKSHLLGCMVAACSIFLCDMAWGAKASAANDGAKLTTMKFEWNSDVPSCGAQRAQIWISAVGPVTETTAADFEAFAGTSDLRGALMVLDSEGGSVLSAIELGRAIRRREMMTTVGKTTKVWCSDGTISHSNRSPSADCESMCAFILLGGVQRSVPTEARVLVHQIWPRRKRKGSLENDYTADDVSIVQRDLATLARYTVEMGASIELVEAAARVPPWQALHALSREEIRQFAVSTEQTPVKVSNSTAAVGTQGATQQTGAQAVGR